MKTKYCRFCGDWTSSPCQTENQAKKTCEVTDEELEETQKFFDQLDEENEY